MLAKDLKKKLNTNFVPKFKVPNNELILFCFILEICILVSIIDCKLLSRYIESSSKDVFPKNQEKFVTLPTPNLNIFKSIIEKPLSSVDDIKTIYFNRDYISPNSVSSQYRYESLPQFSYDWYSPIWFDNYIQDEHAISNLPTVSYHDSLNGNLQISDQVDTENPESSPNFPPDSLEMGSGYGPLDGQGPAFGSSDNPNQSIQPTPVLSGPSVPETPRPDLDSFQTDNSNNPANSIQDNPPLLNQRLPKLIATSGQVWRYFIPFDLFVDDVDGDLQKLRSIILRRKGIGNGNEKSKLNQEQMNFLDTEQLESISEYYSWIRYDESVKFLYALPTELDIGIHEYVIMVSDQSNQYNRETFEIQVRQHQSTRAFTHIFSLNQIRFDKSKFPSMVDAIGELIKRISTKLFMDHPFESIIVHSYQAREISSPVSSKDTSVSPVEIEFDLTWSNSSVPVYPCNLTELDQLTRLMINTTISSIPYAGFDWLVEASSVLRNFTPSQELTMALEPDFTFSSIGLKLRGSCESSSPSDNVLPNVVEMLPPDSPRVKIRIGKLNWILGQPIEYRVPEETFEVLGKTKTLNTKDLKLSLHTIDGLTLDKDSRYNFLEFDPDTQTIFGLPYSLTDHTGQKELQLTAYEPTSGRIVREVFIMNIEAQDLTLRDNRAFKVSMYLIARTRAFGPRERVSLAHKIMASLRLGDPSFRETSPIGEAVSHHELIVMDIQKYALETVDFKFSNITSIEDPTRYPTIMRIPDGDPNDQTIDTILIHSETDLDPSSAIMVNRDDQSNFLYKFIWTNETIGFRGECPEEVIKESIIGTLEQFTQGLLEEDTTGDIHLIDQTGFYNRLENYFEPETKLVSLRIEPMGACTNVIYLHEVGNGNLSKRVDEASLEQPNDSVFEQTDSLEQPIPDSLTQFNGSSMTQPVVDQNRLGMIESNLNISHYEEYWLVFAIMIALLFVIIVFALGMHTYKKNQDKAFELQVRLAQARQNSMFLSSMVLANQLNPNDITSSQQQQNKSYSVVQNEDTMSRKPVILDSEKQHLLNKGIGKQAGYQMSHPLRSATVQLTDQNNVQTLSLGSMPDPMQTNNGPFMYNNGQLAQGIQIPASVTLSQIGQSPSMATIITNPVQYHMISNVNQNNLSNQSMTLHRRIKNQPIRNGQVPMMNHSQSILTVASLSNRNQATPVTTIHQIPPPVPAKPTLMYTTNLGPSGAATRIFHDQYYLTNGHQQIQETTATPLMIGPRSPSTYSSSTTSITAQSVIANPNFLDQTGRQRGDIL